MQPPNRPQMPPTPAPPPPYPYTAPPQPYGYRQPAPPPARPQAAARWQLDQRMVLLALVGTFVLGTLAVIGAVLLGLFVIYGSGDIVPGVSAGGIELGGKTEAEAVTALTTGWNSEGILLRDGERTWRVNPAELGLAIDATGTAAAAHAWGRSEGGLFGGLEALFGGAEIEPKLNIDLAQTTTGLENLRPQVEQVAVNAGVRLINGQVQAVPPVQGRVLDVNSTLTKLQTNAALELADGALDLVMIPVAPAITDATPLIQQASSLLSSPLTIEAYDPVNDEAQNWMLAPAEWSQWLVANPDSNSPMGLSLALDENGLTTYLNTQASQLPAGTYLETEDAVQQINTALAENNLNTWVRVYHHPTTYTVQSGDSMSSIGYALGIPYPWIQAANPGISELSVGQQINIPSLDDLLPLPVIRNKRIVVSISEQHLWAYENGTLVFDWVISTGISRSPTSPGVFQIRSHEPNAYAAQWNLYMPHFMGVYNPGPGAEVMNGFHGFPTDAGGGYLLWTNNLGRPATYGCILLSLENAETLYNWAQEGVVVEITR